MQSLFLSVYYIFCLFWMCFSVSSFLYSEMEKKEQDLEFHHHSEREPYEEKDRTCFDAFTFNNYNLEENAQPFILETKEIKIPGYPYSFNPSITLWRGKILMAFRIRNSKTQLTNQIGLVWLDANLNLASQPYILEIPKASTPTLHKEQDPRLITIKDRLYMVYSDCIKGILIPEVRRIFLTEIHFNGSKFFVDTPEGLFHFEKEQELRWEKNWVPFDYQGNLLLAYSLIPHRILCPVGNGRCETVASTLGAIYWEWGILRGGTQALLDKDQYLSFFHSSIPLATLHSNEKKITHYFMGAYTFSAEPPFAITQISPFPIIGKNFYTSPSYKTWKPLRVVFPGGFIMKDNDIWVVYGKQDFEVWAMKIDKKKLLQSLVPVSPIPSISQETPNKENLKK